MLAVLGGGDEEGVLIGLDAPDDAAVYAWDDDRAVVSTLDFFTPIVDDPYLFGAIAATNALSDIYAMGAQPHFALNIVAFPVGDLDMSILGDILRGGHDKAKEAGVPVIGGHSIDDKEPKYGMVVIGSAAPGELFRKADGRTGDRLVITKAIGTGMISTAIKRGDAPNEAVEAAVQSMLLLNAGALATARGFDVGAITDVTGFGLLGHLSDLARLSDLAAVVESRNVPLLPRVREIVERGNVPGGTQRNFEHIDPLVSWAPSLSDSDKLILCDAQTSGGLLISVAAADSRALLDELLESGLAAAEIGELVAGVPGAVDVR